jgi:hypothetical protein
MSVPDSNVAMQEKSMLRAALQRLKYFLEVNQDSEDDGFLSTTVLEDKLTLINYIPNEFEDLRQLYYSITQHYAPLYPYFQWDPYLNTHSA